MYNQIARYYDLLHDHLVADVAFVSELAGETSGPILELGCGTGRLLLPLARQGRQVTGVDASEAMLAVARTKLGGEPKAVRARVNLKRGDICTTQLEGPFDLAVLAYNTILHLAPAALISCLQNVSRHLTPGGMLFIDVDNPTEVHDPGQDGLLLLQRAAYNEEEQAMVVLMVSSVGDGAKQTRDTVWLVDISAVGGGAVRRTVARSTLHYYFAHQLVQRLEEAGFALRGQYGDYDGRPYSADESERLLLLAVARESTIKS